MDAWHDGYIAHEYEQLLQISELANEAKMTKKIKNRNMQTLHLHAAYQRDHTIDKDSSKKVLV